MSKLRIDPNELTLDQVDKMTKLVEEGSCGQTVAMAFVVMKAENPNATLNDARNLRTGDVDIVQPKDESDEDETEADFLTESA